MKKFFILFVLIISISLLTGCNNNQINDDCSDSDVCSAQLSSISKGSIEKLEIYHFHGTNQCYSCVTVGEYAEETVNTYFSDELKSGMIVFASINAELVENRDVAVKYGATSSSLWLGVYDSEGFHAEQNTNVWYKIKDKEDYMNYLKGVIEKRLVGDFS